jgi:hypothetical protein
VKWYRFDRQGTYDIALRGHGAIAMETYLGDDFSQPQPPYSNIVDPERGTRFVLAAPFFIKVFQTDRAEKASYDLDVHRHEGQDLDDAIVLVPGVARHEHFPEQQFNLDSPAADWETRESKWFIVETPRIHVPGPIDLALEVTNQQAHPFSGPEPTEVVVSLGEWDGEHPPANLLDQRGPDSGPVEQSWQATEKQHFVITVQRTIGAGTVVDVDIEVRTTLSLLLARPAIGTTLVCREETSGWGADDIALHVAADGDFPVKIPNSVIGDFEQDSVRTVGDKLPEIMPYVEHITVTVVEEDDIDDDDVGSGQVPLAKDATSSPDFAVLHAGVDGRVEGSIDIRVDDGRYGFACVISRWHPSV